MSGLIWAGIGQGIANAGRTMGDYMMRSEMEEERQREKSELQRERLAQAERESIRQEQLRRDMAAASAAARQAGDGGRGSRAREYTDDEIKTMAVGTGAFSSGPEVDAFRNSIKTGDFSQYKQDVTRGTVTDQGDPYNPDVTVETSKEYPPGFETIVKKKAETLANITRESVQSKDLKDVNDGRDKGWELETKQGVLTGNIKPESFASAQAAEKGKLYDNTGESGTYNVATGSSTLNKLGEAKADDERASVNERNAAAAKNRREASSSDGGGKAPTVRSTYVDDQGNRVAVLSDGNTKILGKAGDFDKTVANLVTRMAKDDFKFAKLPEEQKRRIATERLTGGDMSSPTSSSSSMPEPKTKSDFDKLPSGTRYKAPDGTIRIK